MPAPTVYTDITAFPFTKTVTVEEFNTANAWWFRVQTDSRALAFGWFIGLSTGFSAATTLYEADGETVVDSNTGDNAMWRPIANHSTYYIKIVNNLGGGISVPF